MTSSAVYITNLASFLPNEPVDNDRMERILGQIGPRPSRVRRAILRSNGIRSRHYAIDPETLAFTHTNASLTAEAIRGLEDEAFALEQMGCLAAGTTIADQVAPHHGLMVQGELGLSPKEVIGTAGICLSGVSAFKYAWMSVATGEHERAVATGSELASPILRAENFSAEADQDAEAVETRPELAFEKDFLRWMLSDGAGAALIERWPRQGGLNLRIDWVELISYAGEMETCMYAGATKQADGSLRGWTMMDHAERGSESAMAIKQDVKLLNDHVMDYTVYHPMREIRARRGLSAEDYDWFLPHFSSYYFRDAVHDRMQRAGIDIPLDRWYTNLATKGNTGAASIYIMLAELFHSGQLERGQRLLGYIPESGRFSTAFMSLTVE